jgi:2-methylisocitrate lyase-like PEP mutase family enzyme
MTDKHAALAAAVPGYQHGRALSVPGVWDGLSMRLVEQAGFSLAFLSGGALSMARHGRPDIGLVTLSELATTVSMIRETSALPMIVDVDTGFGNALNAQRTMVMLEAAGATAVQLEDQTFPKRCGHLVGKSVVPIPEAVGRIKAMLDARKGATLLITRTDARRCESFEQTMERAAAYAEAGADLLFIEGPQSVQEMQEAARLFAAEYPLVHNLVEGGTNPIAGRAELDAMGYAIGLHPLIMLHGFIRQAPALLGHLRDQGSTVGLDIANLSEFADVLGTAAILDAAKAYE